MLSLDPLINTQIQNLTLPSTVYWFCFFLGLIIFGIESALNVYHWITYSPHNNITNKVLWVYFGVAAILIIFAILGGIYLMF